MKKPILSVDFDGVIHSHRSKWVNARVILDPPVKGAIPFLIQAIEDFEVHIYSSRSKFFGGRRAMKQWLKIHFYDLATKETNPIVMDYCNKFPMDSWDGGLINLTKHFVKQLKFPLFKSPALIHIDDRAMCFAGKFPDLETLKDFKPWNKSGIEKKCCRVAGKHTYDTCVIEYTSFTKCRVSYALSEFKEFVREDCPYWT